MKQWSKKKRYHFTVNKSLHLPAQKHQNTRSGIRFDNPRRIRVEILLVREAVHRGHVADEKYMVF